VPFAPPPLPKIAPAPLRARGLLAVRTLRPALELEVETSDDGRPRALRPIPSEANAKRPDVRGMVAVAAGPWALEEGWWSEAPMAREYWDVELAGGGLGRFFRDAASGAWYADGAYD
jgi:protein ImuB